MTAVVGSIGSRAVYVRAQFADGAVVEGNFSIPVQFQGGFKWMDAETLNGSGCVVSVGQASPCNDQPVNARFTEIFVASTSSATIDIL